jgi:hypothetical protein
MIYTHIYIIHKDVYEYIIYIYGGGGEASTEEGSEDESEDDEAPAAAPAPVEVGHHPGDNPRANGWFLESTPIQMLPPGGSICGRLT